MLIFRGVQVRDLRVNYLLLTAMYATVAENHGITQEQIGRAVGICRANVFRKLPVMEALGFLMWEDKRGRIYSYRILGSFNASSLPEAR